MMVAESVSVFTMIFLGDSRLCMTDFWCNSDKTRAMEIKTIRISFIDGFVDLNSKREIPGIYYQQLPIIALTASTLHDETIKFRESGMDGHVLKPFNPDEIKSVLAKFLNKKG